MAQPINPQPKIEAFKAVQDAAEVSLSASVDQTIALAREWRSSPVAETGSCVRLDFHSLMRVSGRWILASDICALVMAVVAGGMLTWLAHSMYGGRAFQDSFSHYLLRQITVFCSLAAFGLLWLGNHGHYRQRLPYWEMIGHILAVAVVGFILGGFVEFVTKDDTSRLWMGLSWLCFFHFILMGRGFARRRLDRRQAWKIPALIVGDGISAAKTRRALASDPHMGFSIVGQVPAPMLDALSKPEAWKHFLAVNRACHVFLALDGSEFECHHGALKAMTRARVPCSIMPPWLGMPTSSLSTHHFMMHDVTLMHDTNRLQLLLPGMLKRCVDVVLSGTALLLLAPILGVVALGVRRDGGPAFFRQQRVGRHGESFECYKFRSMRVDAEQMLAAHLAQNVAIAEEWQHFQKLKNDVRITGFGDFIRRTSIDELPQLFNVLKGDMSLVGPRPCLPGQQELYDEDFSYYTSVRPGITGPWQVSGRNKLAFGERVALEAWYVRNWNLWMDIVILLKTLPALLGREQAF